MRVIWIDVSENEKNKLNATKMTHKFVSTILRFKQNLLTFAQRRHYKTSTYRCGSFSFKKKLNVTSLVEMLTHTF